MRDQQQGENKNQENGSSLLGLGSDSLSMTSVWNDQVYHELSDIPVTMQDPWKELESNMAMLQDLQARLAFSQREMCYLLKV